MSELSEVSFHIVQMLLLLFYDSINNNTCSEYNGF